MEILSVKNLNFTYPESGNKSLSDISFSVNSGDIVLLCGETGSGKTTLLKMLKKEISPFGQRSGEILFCGENAENAKSSDIGFVFQDVESQIVCDKVWHELAFTLENTGTEPMQMRRRVAETASYFGISDWFYKNTSELSGGQKQLLNLASVTVGTPKLILLDEPLSQLDPIACVDFINTVKRLNDDLGVTFIISEHRTGEIISVCNKIAVMKQGKLISYGNIREKLPEISSEAVFGNLPDCAKIWRDTGKKDECPLNVREGKIWLSEHFTPESSAASVKEFKNEYENTFECKNVYFRYSKDGDDIIKGLNFACKKGEVHCVLGANGSGKTTLVKLISGVLKPYSGKISIGKGRRAALLMQNVKNMFVGESVEEDMRLYCKHLGLDFEQTDDRIYEALELLGIADLRSRHPFDLSGGEIQKCAIAKLLISKPDILLMDEPVKSLDCVAKDNVKDIIKTLSINGITVIAVTHDTEFAAEISDRCSLLFDGEITACDVPQRFFSDNSFYTTGASKISRGFADYAVTCKQVSALCAEKKQ